MSEQHKKDGLGRRLDGVDTVFTSRDDLVTFDNARLDLQSLKVPKLLRSGQPHDRLFVANFDGTGNHAHDDVEHITNIGRIANDVANSSNAGVGYGYVNGPGTDGSKIWRAIDSAWGASNDARVRDMYVQLSRQVEQWLADDPRSDIRVLTTGFSRGAEEAALFARLLHDRGVVKSIDSAEVQLVAPGSIPQSVLLFDPVGTGHPRAHDRYLPPSVVSGMQIVARDEKRSQFPSTSIIRQGRSDDGRFLGVTIAGSHSDIGGSYHMDGLAIAVQGLAADYVNAHSDIDLVRRPALRERIEEYDHHKSEEHIRVLYDTDAFDRLGFRDTRGAERDPGHCRPVEACAPPEPADVSLMERVGERFAVTVGDTPLDLIGRELPVEQALEDGPRLPKDIAETQALISRRSLDPDTSWADHFQQNRHPSAGFESGIEFSVHGQAVSAPTSPAHPTHRDHHLYNSIHDQLTTVHKEEGITLSPQQMDRLAHCSVATAKQCGMSDVSHLSLGQDKQGNLLPEVHLYQAFRGDVDDPRTKWGKLDALEAFQTPVETASRDLQVANQQMDQVQQDQQMRMAQQQEQGMSMSR